MAADPAHVESRVEPSGDVQPEPLREDDERHRRPEHLQHRSGLRPRDEGPRARAVGRLDEDDGAAGHEEHTEPEREEPALGTIGAPADAEPGGVEDDDGAQQHQEGRGDDIRDAGFVIVGGIALSVTGRGHESGGEQERDPFDPVEGRLDVGT